MQEQQRRILSFGELDNFNREAILYCIGAFGEAGKQLMTINKDSNKEAMLGYCREWRNEIFHDTGESVIGEFLYPDSEVSDDKIRPACGIISRYDFQNHSYVPILTETTTTPNTGIRIQTNIDMNVLIEMARSQIEGQVEAINQEEAEERSTESIGSGSSSSNPTQLEAESEVTEEEQDVRKSKRARLEGNAGSTTNVEKPESSEATTKQSRKYTEQEELRKSEGEDRDHQHSRS